MKHKVKIKLIDKITHDVLQIETEKPQQYTFIPGSATDVSINKQGWEDKKRKFIVDEKSIVKELF